MDASERWTFDESSHNPDIGLHSPIFSFDAALHPAMNHSTFSLDAPLIDLEEGWSKPVINEEYVYPAHSQHVHHSIYHEPSSWQAPPAHHYQHVHPSFQPIQQQHIQAPIIVKQEPINQVVSPFILDSNVAESINNQFYHTIHNQCDSDSERSDRSDRTTGLSSSSQSSYMEHSPVSNSSPERTLVEVLNSGLTAADLRRPHVQRKRRMTSAPAETPAKPVALMDEEEKRERNKQSASDYRKRRKNYVSDLENRLDAATAELSRKEEALRIALNEITSLKEQMSLFHSMAFKKEGQVSIPIQSVDQFHAGKRTAGISGMSKGRRVGGAKGAMSLAMLTILSCLFVQFGFFDTSIGAGEVGFASQAPVGMDDVPEIVMSSYQAGAPDCTAGGCNKNRFLYWENDNQIAVNEVINLDDEDVRVDAVVDETAAVDLDVDATFAQMQAVVNATSDDVENEWMGDGVRSPMGYLDAESYIEDSDRELNKLLSTKTSNFGKLDLVSMIASLFRWTTPGTS